MLREHFSRALAAAPGRLHFSAHSHHLWPDCTREAQLRMWDDAAELADRKWDRVLGEEVPEAQRHIARVLGLSDPGAIALAPTTHELVNRVLSCLEPLWAGRGAGGEPLSILTTDAEFHSFNRQSRRLEEAGLAAVERVAAEPFESFPERFAAAVGRGGHHLIYLSQVFFGSGYAVPDLAALVAAVPDPATWVVIDGYHGFMALPTDLSAIERRAFYTGGGYKYAMSGEGICYLHCPPGWGERPVETGWFGVFGKLEEGVADGRLPYSSDGFRFWGATFAHAGLYRFNAVQRWLEGLGIGVAEIHRHVRGLQERFLERVAEGRAGGLAAAELIPPAGEAGDHAGGRGHFLTFRRPDAGDLRRRLEERGVIVDHRDDRLRIGFGVYHDEADVERLCSELSAFG
jgi:selenocysteine lyase/cysteine desulfurase